MAAAGPALTVLDVGHGSCAVLVETGRTVVFDAGPKSGLLAESFYPIVPRKSPSAGL